MLFRIKGVDRESGQTLPPFIVETKSEADALSAASERGVLVESIRQLPDKGGSQRSRGIGKKMVDCRDCGQQVSVNAVSCPHCGSRRFKPGWPGWAMGTVLVLFGLCVCSGLMNAMFEESGSSASRRTTTAQTRRSPEPTSASGSESRVYRQGDQFKVGYLSYVVHGVKWRRQIGRQGIAERPNAMFLEVEVSVRNDDSQARMIPSFALLDDDGNQHEQSAKAWRLDNAIDTRETLNPGVIKRGMVLFDIQPRSDYSLIVSGGYWSREIAAVVLAIPGVQ